MFNSTVLEVAIGLVFCYASVALIASSVYEAIASWLSLRSNTLLTGISDLINGKTDEGQTLLLKIYNCALAHPTGSGDATSISEIKSKPSYMPSKDFALAFIHSIQSAPSSFSDLRTDIEKLKDPQLKQLLLTFHAKAEDSFDNFQHQVAGWFDAGMGRISGAYKKQSQLWCFVIAFVICVLFNIDSIQLFKVLWLHPATVAQLAVQNASAATASQAYDQLQLLPIGWNGEFSLCALIKPSAIAGWLVTASATLFGAPFWFDMLKTLVRLRGTGTKPESETASKDAAKQ